MFNILCWCAISIVLGFALGNWWRLRKARLLQASIKEIVHLTAFKLQADTWIISSHAECSKCDRGSYIEIVNGITRITKNQGYFPSLFISGVEISLNGASRQLLEDAVTGLLTNRLIHESMTKIDVKC